MTDVVFVDTNILIYTHDRAAGQKRERAARALERLWDEQSGRVSVQVLQEFYVTITQKLAGARATAREVIRTYTPGFTIRRHRKRSYEPMKSASLRNSRSGMR